jgi:uncharacterized damage-inducible protein DinB
MDPVRIYDYLMRTRERIFDAVRSLSQAEYQQSFGFGLAGGLGPTLAHLMTSEWYYIERLESRTVPPYEQWPFRYEPPHTPAFDVIEMVWRTQGQHVRNVIAGECDWNRAITWLGFPDDTRGNKRFHITCTAGDLFTQLALHEAHHRAQALAMLRLVGRTIVQDIDFNALMFERREAAGEV